MITCSNCGNKLTIKRIETRAAIYQDLFEVSGEGMGDIEFSLLGCTSKPIDGELENQEYLCYDCGAYIDDDILDLLFDVENDLEYPETSKK